MIFLDDVKATATRTTKGMVQADELTKKFMRDMNRYKWKESRPFMSQVCYVSKRRIGPFQKAMKGVRLIHGPGTPVKIIKWVIPEEYTMAVLRGDL